MCLTNRHKDFIIDYGKCRFGFLLIFIRCMVIWLSKVILTSFLWARDFPEVFRKLLPPLFLLFINNIVSESYFLAFFSIPTLWLLSQSCNCPWTGVQHKTRFSSVLYVSISFFFYLQNIQNTLLRNISNVSQSKGIEMWLIPLLPLNKHTFGCQ